MDVDQTASVSVEKQLVEQRNNVFVKGCLVEVTSDEDGYDGAWFVGTVLEILENGNYMIEYQSLRNDDDTEFLKEEIKAMNIRPCPPEIAMVGPFNLFEEVDALYNDGWWVGVISKVLDDSRYVVFFRDSKEELEFQHSELRRHQEWIDGKWVMASQDLKLFS